jgi:hypothetical protein
LVAKLSQSTMLALLTCTTEVDWTVFLSLQGLTYVLHPMPGAEEFVEAVKKSKLDTARKNPNKHPEAAGKKKVEVVKAAPSRGKASLKRPSAVEVASARPLK